MIQDKENTSAAEEQPVDDLEGSADSEKVSVRVDKKVYGPQEDILVTLYNACPQSVFSHVPSGTPVYAIKHIQKRTSPDAWENFFAQCQPPHCRPDIDGPAETKPGQSSSFTWEPRVFVDGTRETARLDPGTYRLEVLFEEAGQSEWMSVYTNEFEITK